MKNELIRGVGWVSMTRILLSVLGLISTVVLARILVPADFGIVAVATATMALLQAITQLSLASALIHKKEVLEDELHTVWTLSVVRSVVLTVGLAAASPFIANAYHDQRLVSIMLITALTGGLGGLTNPLVALQAKELQFRTQFLVQIVQKGSVFVASVGLAIYLRSYWALVLGAFISTALTTIWSYFIVPYRPKVRLANVTALLSFSIWLSLAQFVGMLSWRFDQLLIGGALTKSDLGAYVMADNLASLPTREATQPLTQVLFPGFSKVNGDPDKLRAAFNLAQSALAVVSFPIGFGFALVARPAVLLTMGEKWGLIIPLVQILSCVFAVNMLASPLQALAMATNNNKFLFLRELQGIAVRIPFVLGGLWLDGLMGVTVARALTTVVGTFLVLRIVTKTIGIPISEQVWLNWRTFAATGFMVAVGESISLYDFGGGSRGLIFFSMATAAAAGLAYLGAIVGLWIVTGRKPGPEAEASKVLSKLMRRQLARASG